MHRLVNHTVACVGSVSNRIIAQKLEREQLPRRTRAETLATWANHAGKKKHKLSKVS